MTTNSFCESVLNAIHANNPCTIKSYSVLYAAGKLVAWYLDNTDKQDPRYTDKYERYLDFGYALATYRDRKYPDAPRTKEHRQMQKRIRHQHDTMRRILDAHWNEELGVFEFHNIVFG